MAGIFLIEQNGTLVELKEQLYDSEAHLQGLLASYPNLLAGDQMDEDEPRRWILIAREMAVPSDEDGSARWWADHLFIDQDGIPTIVEVKRSSDSRIRREVVGQMLDYAANAVRYWPVESLRTLFEDSCRKNDPTNDPFKMLTEALGLASESAGPEKFWLDVKTNLEAGRIRMVFVADEIPLELASVVEFLNAQMDPAEVLAVEVKQFANGNVKTLVPRLIGLTAGVRIKRGALSREWNEATFFEELGKRRAEAEAGVCRQILTWARTNGIEPAWGKGSQDGSFMLRLNVNERTYHLLSAWTYGRVEIQFQPLKREIPFDQPAQREKLLSMLNQIPGVVFGADALERRPSIPLQTLTNGESIQRLFSALD